MGSLKVDPFSSFIHVFCLILSIHFIMTILQLGYIYQVFLLTFLIILLLLWIKIQIQRPANLPPGPITFPLIGNLYNLAGGNLLRTMRNLRNKYGDIFSLSAGSHWVIVVNGTKLLRELLINRGELTSDRPQYYVFRQGKYKGMYYIQPIKSKL